MLNEIMNALTALVGASVQKAVPAVLILVVGLLIVRIVMTIVKKLLEKTKLEKAAHGLVKSVVRVVLYVLLGLIIADSLGIDVTSIVALASVLTLAVSLSVQNALTNVIGGFTLLYTHPFKSGDFVEVAGKSGTVQEISMTYTKLATPDNKVIYLPNGALSSGNIINYSEKDTRRVDFSFSIAYNADSAKAMSIIQEILNNHQLVLKDPATFVRMSAHGNSKIEITARAWVNSADYWTVNFDIIESVKAKFDEIGISIPHEQLDVHLKNA